MADAPLLELSNVETCYGLSQVLFGLSLTIAPGEMVTLMGRNGMGKTTTVRSIMGIVPPKSGAITFDGRPLAGLASFRVAQAGIGLVPEGRQIFPNLTVRENLELGSFTRARARRAQNLERAFGIFPRLRERVAQKAGTMSGGEQQMLAIGRGLMAEPRLLILDEPSLGLSPILVEEMFTLIRRLRDDGLTVLLVEQNVGQSLEIADRAYVLQTGRVVMSGPAADIARDADVQKAYLGM